MPGFSIVYDQTGERAEQELRALNEAMAAAMMHFEWYVHERASHDRVALSKVSLGLLDAEPQPITNEDDSLVVMLYGEVYDVAGIRKNLIELGHKFRTNSDAELVLHLYEEKGEDFVRRLNGSFVILIYDKSKHRLLVCNDRYGTRPLYWCKNRGLLLLASEIKAILADKRLERKVNFAGLVDFVVAGYLLHNKTLLEGIEIFPAATILVAEGESLRYARYWSWYDISRQSLHYDDAVERMGQLWIQAVRRCAERPLRLSVTLSGGLDSRAVLAAAVELGFAVTAWTFGPADCLDVKIARRVCAVLGVEHHVWLTSAARWRQSIEQVVWLSDGLMNLVHAHALGMLVSMREHADVRLHAFAGDLVAGGSYLLARKVAFSSLYEFEDYLFRQWYPKGHGASLQRLQRLFRQPYARSALSTFADNVAQSVREFVLDPNATDFYFLNNRVRRFTNNGATNTLSMMVDRKPFLDNHLVDFVYGLPTAWRADSHIYSDMLLHLFPSVYKTIPWQKTGVPIGLPRSVQRLSGFLHKGRRLVNAASQRVGLPTILARYHFADYNDWMRNDQELREYIVKVLLSHRALDRGYFQPVYVREIVESHMRSREDHAHLIGILLAFEIFCRQFLDGDVAAHVDFQCTG
jgi:asparagine synthase (glutamine-hydrolysing)